MIAIITCGHRPDDERIYIREIKSLLKAGHKITYFTKWDRETNLSEENLWHRNYSEKNLSLRDYTKNILNDFKVLKPSIVHIHEFELLPLASKAKKVYDSKIIYDVHEANIELWDAFSSKPIGLKQIINKALDQFEKKNLKYVDRVLTTAPVLVERYENRGIRSALLPNYPLDLPRRNTKSETKTIIYHGQISFERGLADLIRAVPPLVKDDQTFKLEIYGQERLLGTINELKKLSQELDIYNYVNIYNQIPHNKMLKILSSAYVVVIPFRNHPMFQISIPVKLFEAMWAKCAIVASEVESIKKYDENFIEFYPPGNIEALSMKLRHLLNNESEVRRLGEIGAKLIKNKYNWDNVEDMLLKVYAELEI
jgi:glycosyltransferase involved in cell wall biosynthesis